MNQIDQYVHRRDVPATKKTRIGMLVARNEGGEVVMGWSRCNSTAGDKFSREEGLKAAIDNLGKPLPISLARRSDVTRFRGRAARYFKDMSIPAWERPIITKSEMTDIFDEANS